MFAVQALEGIKLERIEKNILSDICKGNYNRDQEELPLQTGSLGSLQTLIVLKLNGTLYRVVKY